MWHQHTNLAIVEYWRWWVVHLWVEGFFEVFATVVIAFLFTRLGLLRHGHGHRRGPVLDHHLPVRRHHRHVPPPLLRRHADGRPGAGGDVQRAGGGAAGPDRLRGLREPDAEPGAAVGGGVQVADLLLRRRGVLEPRRRRPVRLPDQPADRPLLHAGAEHDAGARPHGAVRRLRHARHRPDAVLPEGPGDAPGLEDRGRWPSPSGRSTSGWP